MKLYMKIGTMPACWVSAPKIRKAPTVGQWIQVREDPRERYAKLSGVLVDGIRDVGGQTLYLAARM